MGWKNNNKTRFINTNNPDVADDRSSTASHYSRLFGTATAGEAEHEFYGIPLSADITGHSTNTYLYLGLLILILLLKPYILPSPNNKNSATRRMNHNYLLDMCLEMSFWFGIATALYFLREVTLYPLLSVIILTRTSYPYLIAVAHCIVAVCSYRAEREDKSSSSSKQPVHWLTAFGMGFFGYGFGGSIVSDLLMGLPVTAMAHARIVPCYILSYLLVWYCPYDFLYQSYVQPANNLRLFLVLCETVDSVTTPMGRISRAARELQNKVVGPLMAGLLAGTGGAMIRYFERTVIQQQKQQVAQSSMMALEGAVYKTLGISIFWWYMVVQPCQQQQTSSSSLTDDDDDDNLHCLTYNGSDLLRIVLVGFHLLWTIGMECQLCGSHPFIFIVRQGWNRMMLNPYIIPFLRLGPYYKTNTDGSKQKKE